MYSPAKGLPTQFNPGKPKQAPKTSISSTTKNVKWVAKLGSQSYGNPVVANGKVFVGTNNEMPRDPKHQGDRSILMCFDEKTGEFLWQLVVPKLASGKVNDWENLGLLSSPIVEGNRVYLVTSRCEVHLPRHRMAWPTATTARSRTKRNTSSVPASRRSKLGPKDADIIWRYDMMDELGVFPHNASNCSVLVVDDMRLRLHLQRPGLDPLNIPSPNSPSFIALEQKDRRTRGRRRRRRSARAFSTANGVPLRSGR